MANLRFTLIALLAILLAAAVIGTLASPASADGNPCLLRANNPAFFIGNIVQLCEQGGQGGSETSGLVPVTSTATLGYIVLLDCGNPGNPADQQNAALWSDVVHVSALTSSQSPTPPLLPKFAQLFSRGAVSFPSRDAVLAGPTVFIQETRTGVGDDDLDQTIYTDAGGAEFHIHSAANLAACDPPAQVPESDTWVLFGTGMAGLAGYATLRWRARRATAPKG